MLLRNPSVIRPIIAVLVVAMLAVALACAGEDEPTAAPTAAATPTVPAASTPLTVDGSRQRRRLIKCSRILHGWRGT